MKKKYLLMAMATIATTSAYSGVEDLLLSEVKIGPTAGEFIEILNNGDEAVSLNGVYITDASNPTTGCSSNGPSNGIAQFYYNLPTGFNFGGAQFSEQEFDFHAKFPENDMIGPGERITIAMAGAANFNDLTPDVGGGFTEIPTYEMIDTNGVANMEEVVAGSIGDGDSTYNSPTLSGSGEVVILYYWDGMSDLVQDLDYVIWGDKCEGVDKTGISVDGPDANFSSTAFQSDTFVGTNPGTNNGADATGQEVLNSFFSAHNSNNSWQRADFTEGTEPQSGGNGATGSNETGENINTTWIEELPNPNTGPSANPTPSLVINEVDAVAGTEFIEIYDHAVGNTNLQDVSVVLYDGNTNQIYNVIELSGTTDGNGYHVVETNLQDGADAVAIYFLNENLSIGGELTASNILDAVVYGTDDADDPELLALLRTDEPQVNESSTGSAATVSNSRCSNGSGGTLRTSNFIQVPPSPGAANTCDGGPSYDDITPGIASDPGQLRAALNNIVKFYHDPQTYDEAWDMLREADADPSNSSAIRLVYSNETMTWNGGGNQPYNREHTWPQTYGFHGDNSGLGSNNPARTDGHHLMLSNENYNSARGNRYYDNCTSSCVENTTNGNIRSVFNHGVGGGSGHGDSNWQGPDNSFETWDFRKGDVARAMFYMDVRYDGIAGDEVDLELVEDTNLIGNGQRFMGKLSTLCQWHFADPVDAIEMDRNGDIEAEQGNRNPFVDHPEWVLGTFPACANLVVDPIFSNGFE